MGFNLLGVNFLNDICWIPGCEWKSLRVVREILEFFDFLVPNDWLDLGVWVVDDQLFNCFVRHLTCWLWLYILSLNHLVSRCPELWLKVVCVQVFLRHLGFVWLSTIRLEKLVFYEQIQVKLRTLKINFQGLSLLANRFDTGLFGISRKRVCGCHWSLIAAISLCTQPILRGLLST